MPVTEQVLRSLYYWRQKLEEAFCEMVILKATAISYLGFRNLKLQVSQKNNHGILEPIRIYINKPYTSF